MWRAFIRTSKSRLDWLVCCGKNEDAFSTLRQNLIINRKHFQWPDWLPQTNLDINELLMNYEEELMKLRGQVQLLVGGPPCQGFSMAGKRTGNDVRNRLYNSYIKFVEIIEPEMLFLRMCMALQWDLIENIKVKLQKGNHILRS